MVNRVRSDSNRTGSFKEDIVDESEFLNHAVEPRARTAQLPPVMVCWSRCEWWSPHADMVHSPRRSMNIH